MNKSKTQNMNNDTIPALTADSSFDATPQEANGEPAPAPAWRCPKCGATVSMNDSRCGACGAEPYFPHMPWCPPLIDDVILPSKTNPKAKEIEQAAKEIGFDDRCAAVDRLFERPGQAAKKKKRPPQASRKHASPRSPGVKKHYV